ncbi:Cucumisin [Vitis vinifera]|uniref:Cucumisin n=1 Tax=Vitis vinifera TaxID=29760 RepID=A0A438JXT3_VITVI|nr:Cucumisin [Vitis vinifera]
MKIQALAPQASGTPPSNGQSTLCTWVTFQKVKCLCHPFTLTYFDKSPAVRPNIYSIATRGASTVLWQVDGGGVEENCPVGMDGVVSVFPNGMKKLLTTRSWDFIGFPMEANRTTTESDIIVGMLDTGIWPESASFSDEGFGPPPTKWKGTCQTSSNFTCNNKIIGARYYRSNGKVPPEDFASPRDSEGHGTHTASTAAGNVVSGCPYADILAAFDDAIADGVDIISLSVGGFFPRDYFEDPIAIGAFHSMKNGILTSNSAGNSGPDPASITNFSPWSLSVAASVIDRKFLTALHLGNNMTYEGELPLNTFEMNDMVPLIYGGDAPNTSAGSDASYSRYCYEGSLNMSLVTGKIVLCDALSDGVGAMSAGAVGTVMPSDGYTDLSFAFPLPTSCLDSNYTSDVHEYINSTSTPTANIQKTTEAKNELAPFVVWFSSRGPNPITRDILSPDIAAPGVNILAAWTEASSLTGVPGDTRVVPYNIISGTSMACPHASGAAAYVKSFHPTWSPAAIKSALMTTASPMSAERNTDLEFAYGAGQLNPLQAANPGLVYDVGEADYVKFLCGQGYNDTKLQLVTGENITCSAATNGTVWDLNYPSFAVSTEHGAGVTRTFTRTVTNVGSPVSTYKAIVVGPPELSIQVEPGVLSFKSLGETQTFTVTVGVAALSNPVISGSLVWDDGVYKARSPIVAYVYDSSV